LNEAVGGSTRSQHCKGQAADIEVPGVANGDVAEWIVENCDFDQLILEFYTPGIPDSGWVHVSYVSEEDNRKSILTASRVDGKTQYSVGINT
jgi:zinc D-Ala-D-Ala carboxypeptidase